MIDEVIARLKDQVPDLGGRVQGAAELADMMQHNRLPQVTPAAHVIPSGLAGRAGSELVGAYRQQLDRELTVMLTIRSHDATGRRALTTVEALIEAIVAAIAGWTWDDNTTGVFRLVQARLADMSAGTIVWRIAFSLSDQLRIIG